MSDDRREARGEVARTFSRLFRQTQAPGSDPVPDRGTVLYRRVREMPDAEAMEFTARLTAEEVCDLMDTSARLLDAKLDYLEWSMTLLGQALDGMVSLLVDESIQPADRLGKALAVADDAASRLQQAQCAPTGRVDG